MHVSKRAFLVLGFSLLFCVPSEHVSKYPFVFGAAAGGAEREMDGELFDTHEQRAGTCSCYSNIVLVVSQTQFLVLVNLIPFFI